ncbi:amino acid ABC transporter permease, partial [Bacillus sp. JJ1503]
MFFDVTMVTRYGVVMLEGFLTTLYICFIGLLLGLVLGAVVCWIKMRFSKWGSGLANVYIEFFRGTPFLIQLFLLYYVGPVFGIDLSATVAGILGLSLYGGAYFAEIFRSGIQSIPKGQIEAARALGIGEKAILARIVIPQMLGLIIAPLTTQIITLVKESAILSVITVQELTFVGQRAISETYNYVEVYTMVALLYWALVTTLSGLFKRWERYSTEYM